MNTHPDNLFNLHVGEEALREKALNIIASNVQLQLHLQIVEVVMDLADVLRQMPTADEDLKVIKILGLRTFNAFAASIKLVLSGYTQNGALILRDILETAFLLDYFAGNRTLIQSWRIADKQSRKKDFAPVKVREALDARDGFTGKRRLAAYELLSELAAHPNMRSVLMLRPRPDGKAVIGPFVEATTLEAAISEMGNLAVQVGEQLNLFFPAEWNTATPSRVAFAKLKQRWIRTFYPQSASGREQTENNVS